MRIGITVLKLSFGKANRRLYGRKLHIATPFLRRRKTKYATTTLVPEIKTVTELNQKQTHRIVFFLSILIGH